MVLINDEMSLSSIINKITSFSFKRISFILPVILDSHDKAFKIDMPGERVLGSNSNKDNLLLYN